MAKKSSTNFGWQFTPRDFELLTAMDRHPLTTDQLLNLSHSFLQPFTQTRLLRRRLSCLRDQGLVRDWPLLTMSRGGSPHYWKLSRDGYRLLHGADAVLPKRRFFEAIAPGHHHHTFCLGEFVVRLLTSARTNEVQVRHFARENSVRIATDAFTVYPDCAFQLVNSEGRSFHFVVELDNGTERIRSRQDVESIERKIRSYQAHQQQFDARDPQRYLVLFVTTRSEVRLQHILDLAAMLQENEQRTLFVGTTLEAFVSGDPFHDALLTDHRGLKRMIIPTSASRLRKERRSAQRAPASVVS